MNQLRSAEDIMYGKLWGPDCPPYEKSILQSAINGAKEYAQQFKEQQKDSGWISVKKRLPESGEEVLTWNGRRMVQNYYMNYCDQDAAWFMRTFTHWQPLPPEPKD